MQSLKAMHEEAYAMGRRDSVPQNALYSIKLRQLANLILVEGSRREGRLRMLSSKRVVGKARLCLQASRSAHHHLLRGIPPRRSIGSEPSVKHENALGAPSGAASTWLGAIDGPDKGVSLCSVLSTGLDRHLSSQVSPSEPGLPCRGSELSPPVVRARLQ